jgi:hypothetical protein
MAEYISLGPTATLTETWMRDAALNGKLPSMRALSEEPSRYFPYRYGHSLWSYIGRRWGDEAIGRLMRAVPNGGVEAAFKRELGTTLEEVGEEWREELQIRLLPGIASLDRAKKFAEPLLTAKRSGGEIFLAPALSNDGSRIAFLSNGNMSRGQVFIDLWLGDAETGKRIERLAPSSTNPAFEELRILYSQSSFSPDGSRLAFTAQRAGRDVIYIMDVESRRVEKRLDLAVESAVGPSWSPDGTRLVFSGKSGGLTDLYIVDIATSKLQRLTQDRFGDLQPQWSPDGSSIVFATDRGEGANLELLTFPRWQIAIYSLADSAIAVLPDQYGLNINPQWAPDGRSIAYVSDRTGIANIFLFDLDDAQHFQLTNVLGAVSAITEYSPAISWARGADRLAFTYFEDGDYTIWSVENPRALRSEAATPPAPQVLPPLPPPAAVPGDSLQADSTIVPVSVVALLDSVTLGLPDPSTFKFAPYRLSFAPDYIARPSIGYAPDSYGRTVFGGTTLVLSDMLGNNRVAFSGEINGRFRESRLFLGYTNVGNRLQYSGGLSQAPYYFLSSDSLRPTGSPNAFTEHQEITVYLARQAFAVTAYPFNRFSRLEVGGGFNNVDRAEITRC